MTPRRTAAPARPTVRIALASVGNRAHLTRGAERYCRMPERLSADPTPVQGGNLFVGSTAIVSTGSIYLDPAVGVTLDGNLTLKKFQGAVPVVSNYNTIYAGNVAAGGSGVYVTTDEGVVDQELITKKRAIVYSIIF